MQNYTLEKDLHGKEFYKFVFAGREIRLTNGPGTIYSVDDLSRGAYESPLPILLMASIARTTGAFCDVGANIGIYSVLATKTRSNLHVYAFEPLPEARTILRENLRINDTLSQAEIFDFALSDSNGQATLHLPDASHGLLETSASLEADFKTAADTIDVQIRTLDSLRLAMPLSVIKADIEGHEAAFLRGAHRTMSEDRPLVFAEMLSGAFRTFFGVSKMMADLEYIPFRMRPDLVIHTKLVVADKGWNYAFIPAEKIELFRDSCRAHDIEMLRSY